MNKNHFDEIDNYDNEIPAHVANYLLEVKMLKIISLLKKYYLNNNKLKCLDLGCGTGEHINLLAATLSRLDNRWIRFFREADFAMQKRKG